MRTLDQTNISNAYVSGMKEDLNMQGNQYILLTTYFTIGYCVFQIPAQLVIPYVKLSIWLPACEIMWGVCVCGMAGAKNVETLYALRFFVGVFETTAYCGCFTILNQWYKKEELAKRTCFFQSSIYIASMFSGYMQSGLHRGMDGVCGLAAWRWLYIFDFIITFVVALIGFLFIPDMPTDTKAWWLNKEEKELALSRVNSANIIPITGLKKSHFSAIFKDWPVYVFSLAYTCQILGVRLYGFFNLWLKSTNQFTVEQVNEIPTGGSALELVLILSYGWISDYFKVRAPVMMFGVMVAMIGAIILSSADWSSNAPIFAGWFLMSSGPPINAFWAIWLSDTLSYSAEHKLVCLGIINAISFAMVAWVPLLLYPSGDAPHYKYAYQMVILFYGLQLVVFIPLIAYLNRRDELSGKLQRRIDKAREEVGWSVEPQVESITEKVK